MAKLPKWDQQRAARSLAKLYPSWWGYFQLVEDRAPIFRLEGWIRRHIRKYFWWRWHDKKGRERKLRGLGLKGRLLQVPPASGVRGVWRQRALCTAFIADYGNRRIRKVSGGGNITTVVGDGGPAADVPLIGPLGLAIDSAGNLFIADYGSVRKVSPDGTITTVAGGGPALSAALLPLGVAVDGAGNLFIADSLFSTRIPKVAPDGIITAVAGNGAYCCFSGDGGPATSAQLNDPASVAVDGAGNLYIADARNGRIRKVSPDGAINTVADACFSPDDIWSPCGIAVDRAGNLYVSDDGGTFTVSGGIKTKRADHGVGLAVDGAGNLFIADQYCHVIRKVSPDGVTTTVAGTGAAGFSGDGGPATAAQLNLPLAVAVDRAGNVFIADSGSKWVRMVSGGGVITTVADASDDLPGDFANAGLGSLLVGLAVDNSGNVFFEEFSSSFRRIRRVSREGIVTTIAGTGVPGYFSK